MNGASFKRGNLARVRVIVVRKLPAILNDAMGTHSLSMFPPFLIFLSCLLLQCLGEKDSGGNPSSDDTTDYYTADRGFIIRQQAIIMAFYHYPCPSYQAQGDFYNYTVSYNPLNHLQDYRNPGMVQAFVSLVESGQALPKHNTTFTMKMCVEEQFQNLTRILEYSFEDSATVFYKTLAYFYSRLNMQMLYTSVNAVIANFRSQGYLAAPPFEATPQLYTPKSLIYNANNLNLAAAQNETLTASTENEEVSNPEPMLSYWRDDPYLNSFHFQWHQNFPFWYNESAWQTKVQKGRQGELFFYVHHNLMTRYIAERIGLNLPAYPYVKPIDFDNRNLELAWYPNTLTIGLMEYPSRPPNPNRPDAIFNEEYGMNVTWSSIKESYNKISQAIANGYLIQSNGSRLNIRNNNGTTILGSTVQPDATEVNPQYYGDLHNSLHAFLSFVSDPNGTKELPPGVLGFTETAMMDPMFYRIHALVDQMYKQHLDNLGPYTNADLNFPGVEIGSLVVQTRPDPYGPNVPPYLLLTYFRNNSWDITNSIIEQDKEQCKYMPGAQVRANLPQLDHKTFDYFLVVRSNASRRAVVRLFLSPFNTFGNRPASLDQIRWGFMELDKFPVQLTSGINYIRRSSSNSSLFDGGYEGIPAFFKRVNQAYKNGAQSIQVNIWERWCGWPRNLYLPRGREGSNGGMMFNLFAMLTDFDQDFLVPFDQAVKMQSISFCSVVNGTYPDRRPMGFPFDRPIANPYYFLDRSNMINVPVNITHLN